MTNMGNQDCHDKDCGDPVSEHGEGDGGRGDDAPAPGRIGLYPSVEEAQGEGKRCHGQGRHAYVAHEQTQAAVPTTAITSVERAMGEASGWMRRLRSIVPSSRTSIDKSTAVFQLATGRGWTSGLQRASLARSSLSSQTWWAQESPCVLILLMWMPMTRATTYRRQTHSRDPLQSRSSPQYGSNHQGGEGEPEGQSAALSTKS